MAPVKMTRRKTPKMRNSKDDFKKLQGRKGNNYSCTSVRCTKKMNFKPCFKEWIKFQYTPKKLPELNFPTKSALHGHSDALKSNCQSTK